MTTSNLSFILVADDDADDKMFISEAFEANEIHCTLQFVGDGMELIEYLTQTGKYLNHTLQLPDIILLDVNMPKKNGKDTLEIIKTHTKIKHIPVVMFSTSNAIDEIKETYKLGANSFITKPTSYDGFLEVFKNFKSYWGDTVSLKKVVKCA
jgi:CheY-like chemotaxis protein